MTTIERLYDHLFWADGQLVETLRAHPDAMRPAARLAHIVAAEAIWLARLETRVADVPVFPAWPLDETERQAQIAHDGFRRLLRHLDPAALDEVVGYRTTTGRAFETARRDILLHVAIHGAHHRGQIAADLRADGVEPTGTDFILWSRT